MEIMSTSRQSIFCLRLVILVLTGFTITVFQGCSKDESGIDEILSDQTTPVTFEFEKGMHFMYDYAGAHFVKGDTINILKKGEVKCNLRQGKHSIVWLKDASYDGNKLYEVHYDAQRKMIIRNNDYPILNHDVEYAVNEVNVSEYMLPTQTIDYSSIMAKIEIVATDYDVYQGIDGLSGIAKGFPNILSVCLTDGAYESGEPLGETKFFYSSNIKMFYTNNIICILCPKDGLDNIQLSAEVKDANGQIIPTTQLPKCSIRRGYITTLAGPLFSGSTSDWEVNVYKRE